MSSVIKLLVYRNNFFSSNFMTHLVQMLLHSLKTFGARWIYL